MRTGARLLGAAFSMNIASAAFPSTSFAPTTNLSEADYSNIRLVAVHGFNGSSDGGWIGGLDVGLSEFRRKGLEIVRLNMPNTGKPVRHEWVDTLNDNLAASDKQQLVVGHSLGNAALLDCKPVYNRALLVAARGFNLTEEELRKAKVNPDFFDFYMTPVSVDSLLSQVPDGFDQMHDPRDQVITIDFSDRLQPILRSRYMRKELAKPSQEEKPAFHFAEPEDLPVVLSRIEPILTEMNKSQMPG